MIELNKLYRADCLDILSGIPDNFFDLCLTDPPYGKNIDKKENQYGLLKKTYYDRDWDKNIPQKKIFDEIFRVSKNQIIFGGNYFTEILPPSNCWLVWDKVSNYNFKNPFAECELAWTSFNKVIKKYTCVQQGFICEDKSPRIHPTQKPLKLFENIVNDFSKENDLILDCFSGSGTTAIACNNLKRQFVCIEKDITYYNASRQRFLNHTSQLKFL